MGTQHWWPSGTRWTSDFLFLCSSKSTEPVAAMYKFVSTSVMLACAIIAVAASWVLADDSEEQNDFGLGLFGAEAPPLPWQMVMSSWMARRRFNPFSTYLMLNMLD